MVIKTVARGEQGLPNILERSLPYALCEQIRGLLCRGVLEEVRLRLGRRASAIVSGRNIMLEYIAEQSDMSEVMTRLCKGSLYAYSDTINQGYITLDGGIRVGVGGRATCEGERVVGVYDVCSLCIRIPHRQKRVGAEICRLLRSFESTRGVLIYSPPGVGKTTLLRGCASILASGESPLRTVVIDTRGELGFSLESEELCLDVLSGYPRRLGIEIATRSMNAQLIICDEIGDVDEAMALVASHNCGVPLIATAHAGSIDELLRRTGIRLLHEAEIFGAYVGLSRAPYMDFCYDVTLHRDARPSF